MNTRQCQRYYVSAEGPDELAMGRAFQWLIDLCRSVETGHTAFLVVPTKANLRGIITSVIGPDVAQSLAANRPVRLTPTCELRLATERTLPSHCDASPVLVAYPYKRLLDKLDEIPGISHMLVVPWILEDVQYWIDTWGATDIDSSAEAPQSLLVMNPVVVEALKTLTNFVNVSTGIRNPADRQAAIDLFRRLRDAGEDFNSSEVRAWLVREAGWRPQDADEVKSIAEGVLSGRRFRGGGRSWKDDIVEQWRSRVKNR